MAITTHYSQYRRMNDTSLSYAKKMAAKAKAGNPYAESLFTEDMIVKSQKQLRKAESQREQRRQADADFFIKQIDVRTAGENLNIAEKAKAQDMEMEKQDEKNKDALPEPKDESAGV